MKCYTLNIAVAAALALLAFAGCKHEDLGKQHYDNKLFISASKFTDEVLIKGALSEASRQISIGVAKPTVNDITAQVEVAPELLETYRMAYYDPQALLLDQACYSFNSVELTISAGSVVSAPVGFEFRNLDKLDKEQRYVLPVAIRSVAGIDEVLGSARNLYFIFRGAALINVVANLNENHAWPDWKNATPVTDMTTFTLETLVCGNAFDRHISTIMGIEDKFLIRIGDSEPKNQIQIATSNGNLSNAKLKLDVGRWYHVAVTFDRGSIVAYLDGVEVLTGSIPTTMVNFGVEHSDEQGGKDRCFWIGYSYGDGRHLDGMFSEARIWDRALTAEQINAPDHFYTVEPDAAGLVAYWKFDDASGTSVKDYTQFGNDLTLKKIPKWVPITLPIPEK